MKKILFMLICLLATGIHHVCTGQNRQHLIDSLLVVLNTAKEDSNEVKTLNRLSENYRALNELDNSKKYAEDAFRLAEKINFKRGKFIALFHIGLFHYYLSNYPEALENFVAALKISQELGDKKGMAQSYNNIAGVHKAHGNLPEALKNFSAALKFFEETKDTIGIAGCYNNIAAVYDNQGNIPEALKSFFASLRMHEKKGDKVGMASNYLNIGMSYANLKNYADALESYFSSLKIYEEIGNKYGISKSYLAIGGAYLGQCDLPEAKDYALRALALSQELDDKPGMAHAYVIIGNIYKNHDDDLEALKNYLKASKLHQEIGDTLSIVQTYTRLVEIYDNLKQFNEAEVYLHKGLLLANGMGSKPQMLEIYESSALHYEKRNDFKNAYKYHKLLFEMHDSVFNEVKSQQIAELKVQYETEKKENEIALLNKDQALHLTEIKKQKILKILFMGGLVLATLLVYFGYLYFRNYQKLKVQTMRNKIASNLHDDVGSTLTSIRLYSEIGKKQTTDPQVSSVFDKIGQNAGEVIHSMSDIVWMINPKYDAFGSVFARMENFASEMLSPLNIRYAIKKDNEVESIKFTMAERQNIFMIFKEAIHNAAKHANCKAVAIHLSRNRDQLQMNITDDGSGFDEQAIQRGNGLINMENRAAEMNGTITVAAALGRGTSVTLNMLV